MTLRHALAHWLKRNLVRPDIQHGLLICTGCDWVRPMQEHRLPTCEPLPPPQIVKEYIYVPVPSKVVRHEHVHYRDEGGIGDWP